MKRNRAAIVTTVSTVMLGAGWVASVIGTAAMSKGTDPTTGALGTGTETAPTTVAPTTVAPTTIEPSATATGSPSVVTAPPEAPVDTTTAVSGTFDGALVSTREGDFQAEIVVANGIITAVNVLVDGDDRRDSVRINQTALPTLQERVLAAQSWNVQGISGASYTVDGFLTSVKDAMAQAGLA